jgi:sigma-E factor negative regulatory protein RseB
MTRTWHLIVAGWLACFAVGFAPSVQAQTAAMPLAQARDLLARIQDAAKRHSFKGSFVVSAGGRVSGSRVTHYCEGDQQYERIDSLDGEPRHVLRHNDWIHTVWPANRTALVERRAAVTAFPSLLQGDGGDVAAHYGLHTAGVDRVAGLEAQVLRLQPLDPYRYGLRLWTEKATGLLLRAEVLGAGDEVLETAAFTELTLDAKTKPREIQQAIKALDGYRVVRAPSQATRLEDEGWSLRISIPGFRQVSCIKRPRDLSVPAADGAAAQMIQSVWSDGLATVSVFIEPFDADRHRRELQTTLGATHTLMHRVGTWWVTVMGDVPPVTLKQFAHSLERVR